MTPLLPCCCLQLATHSTRSVGTWRCEADPVPQHPRSRGTHGLRCRSDLSSFDAFDSASYCRQRFWLFVAYVVSFGSIIGAVTLLLGHMHDGSIPAEPYEKWIGWVRIFHYVLQYEFEDSRDNLARTGIGQAHVAVPHTTQLSARRTCRNATLPALEL